MAVGALLLALLAPQAEATLQEPRAGVTLTYPKAWKLERKRRGPAVFTVPLPNGKTARAEISTATFRGTIDEWKELQSSAANTQKRTVTAQEEQEILGIPLVVTTVEYTDAAVPKTAVTGLVYARTVDKLVYRLVADREDIEEAKVAFRPAIESLRTFDGKPLQAESPGSEAQAIGVAPVTAERPVKPRIISDISRRTVAPKWESAPFAIGERKVAVYALRPATVVANGDQVTVTYGGRTIVFKVALAIDAGSASGTLIDKANAELADWSAVRYRQDDVPTENRVGGRFYAVTRVGTKAGAETARSLVILDGQEVYGLAAIDASSLPLKPYRQLLDEIGLRLLP